MSYLIVDPESKTREHIATAIQWVDKRHRVDHAETGASALEIATRHRPSIAFLNLELPDFDGRLFCNELRRLLPSIACVALTDDICIPDGFDDIIEPTPSRLTMLRLIAAAKRQTKKTARKPDKVRQFRLPKLSDAPSVSIYACHLQDPLSFGLKVPVNTTVAGVLKLLGKVSYKATLMRNGIELNSNSAIVQDCDRIILSLDQEVVENDNHEEEKASGVTAGVTVSVAEPYI